MSRRQDAYHQAWRLIILNSLLGVAVVLVVLASLAMRPAILLAVLVGPLIAAVMHCAVTLAQTEDLRLAEADERVCGGTGAAGSSSAARCSWWQSSVQS